MKKLYCEYNLITQLNNLPPTLKKLYCNNNKITQLDNLPESVKDLRCHNNLLKYKFTHTLENIRNYNKNEQ